VAGARLWRSDGSWQPARTRSSTSVASTVRRDEQSTSRAHAHVRGRWGDRSALGSRLAHWRIVERVTGIEPAFSAWEADVLPLNYTRQCFREGSNAGRTTPT
jgi:hypothetical protein